jgi:hypothetical protein
MPAGGPSGRAVLWVGSFACRALLGAMFCVFCAAACPDRSRPGPQAAPVPGPFPWLGGRFVSTSRLARAALACRAG